jgi:hypothetical protein
MYLVNTSKGQPPRPLTAIEAAAYEAEIEYRTNGAGWPNTPNDKWTALDDKVFALAGPNGYNAVVAWISQFYDRITVAPQSTIAERVYDAVAGKRSMR